MSFLERFKGKTSTINRQGDIGEAIIGPALSNKPQVLDPSGYSHAPNAGLPRNYGGLKLHTDGSEAANVMSQPLHIARDQRLPYDSQMPQDLPDAVTLRPKKQEALQVPYKPTKKTPYSLPPESISLNKSELPILHPKLPIPLEDRKINASIHAEKSSLRYAAYEQIAPVKAEGSRPPLQPRAPGKEKVGELKDLRSRLQQYNQKKIITPGARSSSLGGINVDSAPRYQAYTILDYKERAPQRYFKLGGLGANMGTEEWNMRKDRVTKMTEYAKNVNMANKFTILNNTSQPILPGRCVMPELEQALQKKNRMADYARRIPKPKLPSDYFEPLLATRSTDEPLSELERLEHDHKELMAQVTKLKQDIN